MELKDLNNKQIEAVQHTNGPLLVLAGAGSGKTKVLTTRIAYILENQLCSPYEIMAITFTNKAAEEMRLRVERLLSKDVRQMWIGTFHALCTRILRREISNIGYTSDFTIYDTADQKSLIKEIVQEMGRSPREIDMREVLSIISNTKNNGEGSEDIRGKYAILGNLYAHIYEEYKKKLKRYNALDFDDLILKTIELLKNHVSVREKYQEKFKYILVDEYQDTNASQYELIKILSQKYKNICAVGDTDQSIYGWRGADISNILNFEHDFKQSKVILLEQNYRSTKKILDLANRVIQNNTERKDKALWTENNEGEDVVYRRVSSDQYEAMQICDWISQMRYKGYKLEEMAVLYRTNAQSRSIEETFLREGIHYRVVGGLKFYDRKEIKDIMAYLKLIVNPMDNISLERIINEPKRGIGKTTVEKLKRYATEVDLSEFEYLEDLKAEKFSGAIKNKLLSFQQLMRDLMEESKEMSLRRFVEYLLDQTGYMKQLQSSTQREDQTRIENLSELINSIEDFEQREEENSLKDYLASVSLMSDVDKTKEDQTGVSLMTIHAAKGLEYKIVYLTGLEEGLFPSMRSMDEGNLEEERRLCYVAITRAEEKLFMTSTENRRVFGNTQLQRPSSFLEEMKGGFMEEGRKKKDNFRESFDRENINTYKNEVYEMFRKKDTKKLNTEGYKVGDKVQHKKFGSGIIVEIKKRDNGDEATISFDEKGLKKLNLQLAPLKRL